MAVIAMDMTYPQLLLGAVNKKINENKSIGMQGETQMTDRAGTPMVMF